MVDLSPIIVGRQPGGGAFGLKFMRSPTSVLDAYAGALQFGMTTVTNYGGNGGDDDEGGGATLTWMPRGGQRPQIGGRGVTWAQH